MRLVRGGGFRDVSGPMEGLRGSPKFRFCVDRSDLVPSADTVRSGDSAAVDGLGNVSERLMVPRDGGSMA